MTIEILWAVATLAAVLHIVWLFRWVAAVGRGPVLAAPSEWPAATIIVCAHNEAEALPRCLESLTNQRYKGDWSILVVDDRSTDSTPQVLIEWAIRFPGRIHTLRIDETAQGWAPKKWALWQGLQAAETDCIALTDADCAVPRFWLPTLIQPLALGKSIALGLGRYESRNSLANALVQYDTLNTAIQYVGSARLGRPYMGVGRSLAYCKSIFGNENPFAEHQNNLSGDDDLLVQRYATKTNTVALTNANAVSESTAPVTVGQWLQQKRRHLSAGKFYKPNVKIRLTLFFGLGALAVGLGMVLPFIAHNTVMGEKAIYFTLSGLGTYLIARWSLLAMANQTLRCAMPPIALPTIDLLFIVYQLLSPVWILFQKEKW